MIGPDIPSMFSFEENDPQRGTTSRVWFAALLLICHHFSPRNKNCDGYCDGSTKIVMAIMTEHTSLLVGHENYVL